MFRSNSSAEYIARASKVVTLVDLAGHERYFKTTAYGLTGHMPDYACLIVGANAGLSEPAAASDTCLLPSNYLCKLATTLSPASIFAAYLFPRSPVAVLQAGCTFGGSLTSCVSSLQQCGAVAVQ